MHSDAWNVPEASLEAMGFIRNVTNMQRQFLSFLLLLLLLLSLDQESIEGAHPTHTDYSNLHGEKVNFDFLERRRWKEFLDSSFILIQLSFIQYSFIPILHSLINMINEAPPQIMSKRKLKLQENQKQTPL